jgi:hypothetical protein
MSTHSDHADSAMARRELNRTAASATLHCLTGCAIGEILGLVIGTAAGLGNVQTIVLAIALAFLFGYALSTLPLLRLGLPVATTLKVVLAADTVSIATMEIVDNAVMAAIPGAMEAGLLNPGFWIAMMIALTAAFFAAFPVNRYLLQRGKGHALVHVHHHGGHQEPPEGWRRAVPEFRTGALVAVIVAFMSGALLVAAAAELTDDTVEPAHSTNPLAAAHAS